MNPNVFLSEVSRLPEWVVMDLPEVVRKYRAMFGHLAEYALHLAFVVLMDKTQYRHSLHKAEQRLMSHLITELELRQDLEYDETGIRMDLKPLFMEHILIFTQGVQVIRQKVDEHRAWLFDRYLPYELEGIMPNGEVLVQRINQLQVLEDYVAE